MSLVQFTGSLFGIFFNHKVGRRPLFLIGGLISIAGIFTMAACDY
jgi:F0F1-type ATP synthase assembly protein I